MSEYTQIVYDTEARKDLLEGVKKLASAVKSTLGPKGETVLLKKENRLVVYTKDGVTVADNIKLENPREDIGRQLISEVAYKTDTQAGDGTTTSTVLTEAIVTEGMKSLGGNSLMIKKGMDKTLNRVLEEIKEIATPIKGDLQKMIEVATISANGDELVGKLVADAIYRVGEDGKVDITPTGNVETIVDFVDGMSYHHGSYFSPYLAKNVKEQESIIENPYIAIFDEKISKFSDMINFLSLLTASGTPIVLMMTDVTSNVLKSVIKNKMELGMDLTILRNPRDTGMVEDLATYVGANVINGNELVLDEAGLKDVGTCELLTLKNGQITFTKGNKHKELTGYNQEQLTLLIDSLKAKVEDSEVTDERRELYKVRLAKLNGGVANIQVGGKTEVEMIELRDRIVDSYNSTKSSVEEGVVIGGGFALLRIKERILKDKKFIATLDGEENQGFKLVINALDSPAKQILENGGFKTDVIIDKSLKNKNESYGFDSNKEIYCDLKENGIVDSARNTKIALTNAVSVSSLITTTKCIVIDV